MVEIAMWCSALYNFLSSLPWPIAAVAIAWFFKTQIVEAIPRLREAGPGGVKLDPAKQQESNPAEIKLEKSLIYKKLDGADPSFRDAYKIFEGPIQAEIVSIDQDKHVEVLLDALVRTKIELFFERIYRTIFGSQILALRRLDEQGFAQIEQAEAFYRTFERENPEAYKGYGFEGWSNFG